MATATITPDQNTIVAEIFIAAPPARVFQAISDPTQLPKWWGQSGLYHVTRSTMDVRPGGKWRSDGVGADGQTFFVEGEYLEVDPPRLLVHTWNGSYSPQVTTVVRWELESQSVNALHPSGPKKSGTGTLVRVRQEGFKGDIAGATGHMEGWKRVLGWLEAFVEGGESSAA
ncbi:MAG TPA: SRPBCC domain-containing protein [Candidatus Sulfotelmatobacter sp.]|nr:SRPBCC domain-containing protein [Candidatus Sulfotelmatobacter sp.]